MEHQMYLFGKFYDREALPLGERITHILGAAKAKAAQGQTVPLFTILETLDRIGRRWQDPDYPYRRQAFASLRESLQMSETAATAALDIIPQLLDRSSLLKRLTMSLPYPLSVMDRWLHPVTFPGRIRALPRGVVVHICAGNVFLGALDSLLMGMITKNVNLLKLSSDDPGTILYFAESIVAEDPAGVLANNFAILRWERGNKKIEEAVLSKSDVILVWGGEAAITYYQKSAGPYVHVVGYGPKISLGLVGEQSFTRDNFPKIAARCAHDICLYDQKACSSPQNLFLPSRDLAVIREFAEELSRALATELERQPATAMSDNELTEIMTQRATFRFKAAQGAALILTSPGNSGHTVVYDTEHQELQTSPLNRFIYLKSYERLEQFGSVIAGMDVYLQSVGLYATATEWARWEQLLTALGVTRLAELGEMLTVHDGAPHDATLPLLELIKWVATESPSALPQDSACVRELFRYVRDHSPFYRRHWVGVDLERDDFLAQTPLLTKELFLESSPPDSHDILCQNFPVSPIVFSSGGSTGRPKYSYFANDEFDLIASRLADQYVIQGLRTTDKVANLFVAGHLWSSFLAVDRALNKIGTFNLPIGGQLDFEEMAKYLATFAPNVVMGIPSVLNGLLHKMIESNIEFKAEKIFYAGEFMSEAMVRNFTKYWGVRDIHSAGYASVDAGLIGYQCPHQQGGCHHICSDLCLMELVTPEGQPITVPDVEGEIVVTALYRWLMPFIRYRTGDLGVYAAQPCPCGRLDPVFQLLGRCDDRLQIGGSRIFVKDIEKLLKQYDFLTGSYQFIPQFREREEFLAVMIETNEESRCTTTEFVAEFFRGFYRIFPDFTNSVEKCWIAPPAIAFVPPGTIPQVARTGKIRLIEDRRKE